MKIRYLKEPIVRQVLLLLVVSSLSIISLLMTHRYMQSRMAFIRSLVDNEQVRVELSNLVHTELHAVQSSFQKMSMASTENELQSLTVGINNTLKKLDEILFVMENGGVLRHVYKAHSLDKEELVRRFIYGHDNERRIDTEVIQIRNNLPEMQHFIADFWEILAGIMQQEMSVRERRLQDGEGYYAQLLGAYARLDPFFDRLMDNSFQIYFDADTEKRKLEQKTREVERTFQKRLVWIFMAAGGVILLLGWLVLRNVGKILFDRRVIQDALQVSNKNREEMVRSYTISLEKEAQQREKLQLVVEQNPSSIVITDLDGNIEYVNKQFETITGYTREEALGQNPRILNSGLTPPETFENMWKTLQKGEMWTGELVNRAKNGEIYHENVLLAPLKNDKGELTNYVAIKENITELKKAREAAEASNNAKSQFLSRMSHELRTPLHAINGFSQLLLKKNKNHTLDERQSDQVLQINTAGNHLLELINEILDLSRIESGGITLSLESISVAETVRECIALVASLANESGITIDVDQSIRGVPHIRADLTRFKQVMLNLLSNAIKYSHPGGSVSLSGEQRGDTVHIEVSDNGIGISEEQMKNLFVPFARLGQDDSGIEGTGIGMTISKQLVELMNGTLEATSDPGVGTVFCVRLPTAEEGKEHSTLDPIVAEGDNEVVTERTATFLYIEDNPCNIRLMKFIIEQWPTYSLVVRKNAEKGIKAAAMLNPDIIFMDLHLPGMTGQEAFVELQKNQKTKDIPVIALSADALPTTVEECLQLGFVSYLTKPIIIESLREEIEKCLQR
ncbi:MAG: PAS domain S-box protein [Desulfocapsa sp.]|nr:PAS domain S-box protein [Desulfocapsa sp.]